MLKKNHWGHSRNILTLREAALLHCWVSDATFRTITSPIWCETWNMHLFLSCKASLHHEGVFWCSLHLAIHWIHCFGCTLVPVSFAQAPPLRSIPAAGVRLDCGHGWISWTGTSQEALGDLAWWILWWSFLVQWGDWHAGTELFDLLLALAPFWVKTLAVEPKQLG